MKKIFALFLALALVLGMAGGIWYGFLRPLRPRFTTVADLIFLVLALAGWIYVGFGICQADLGISPTAGMMLGIILEEMTLGRLLRPVFYYIWQPARKIFHFLLIFGITFGIIKRFLRIGDLHEYRSQLQKQEKVQA